MREIKFRFWDEFTNTMRIPIGYLEQYLIFDDDTDRHYLCGVLMQFTGLKDKSGKEIYEGDIVKTIDIVGDEIQGVVEYDEAGYYIHTKSQWNPSLRLNYENHEVIGNIYEHKHLLEAAND